MATTDIVTISDTPTRTAMVTAMNTLIQVGAGSNGTIDIRNGSNNVLVTVDLNSPEFTVGTAQLLMTAPNPSGVAGATPAGGTTATNFQLKDRDGLLIFRGSVGTSGEAMNLSSTTINPGDTVELTAASSTITQPAS